MGWSATEVLTLTRIPGLSQRAVQRLVESYADFGEFRHALASSAI